MGDESDSELQALGATRVDLGDDLVEKTVVLLHPSVRPQVSGEEIADLFQTAKILLGEGLTEDAKKILHQILIQDPSHAGARASLNQLHDLELKQVFQADERKFAYRQNLESDLEPHPIFCDPDEVVRRLDRDLNLSIDQLSLFEDPELLKTFIGGLEKDLIAAPYRDWCDLGIAFMEMELYSIAIPLLFGAYRRTEDRLSVGCLLSLALILGNRALEAVVQLQPLLRDSEIPLNDKTELFYLMGRVYESLNQHDLAYSYYLQVKDQDPQYRDLDQRLRL